MIDLVMVYSNFNENEFVVKTTALETRFNEQTKEGGPR